MRLWLIPLCALLLASCGGEPDDPRTRLRATIASAEQAVEARSLKQASVYLSPHYHDERGYDARAIRQLLLGYLQRHRDIHLFTHIAVLTLADDQRAADVRLYVAMSGVPIPSLEAVAELHADLYRFELHFIDTDEGWQLQRADWHHAELKELLD